MGLNVSQVLIFQEFPLTKTRTGAGHPGEEDIGGLVLVSMCERQNVDRGLMMVSLHERPRSSPHPSSPREVSLMHGASQRRSRLVLR
jgi:hypothetical protein